MVASGKLHGPAAVTSEKDPWQTVNRKLCWPSKSSLEDWDRKKILAPPRTRTKYSIARTAVVIPTTLTRLVVTLHLHLSPKFFIFPRNSSHHALVGMLQNAIHYKVRDVLIILTCDTKLWFVKRTSFLYPICTPCQQVAAMGVYI